MLIYDEIINVRSEFNFEIYRNYDFINHLCDDNFHVAKINLEYSKLNRSKYIVIVPGASQAFRRFSPHNFALLIDEISKIKYFKNYRFIIVGEKSENELAAKILSESVNYLNIHNYIGKLRLNDLVDLIANSFLTITNDTSTFHISASVKANCICLSNGNHFGRFNPYPVEICNSTITIYPKSEFISKHNINLIKKYSKGSDLDIDTIDIAFIISKIINMTLPEN